MNPYYTNILMCVFLLMAGSAFSQSQLITTDEQDLPCELPFLEEGEALSIPYHFRYGTRTRAAGFTINYISNGTIYEGDECLTWPEEAKIALEYAANIWTNILQNNQDIRVDACWSDSMDIGTLGSAGPDGFYTIESGIQDIGYPDALTEQIEGKEMEGIDDVDIISFFNAKRTNWYFGTDANPGTNEVDFVTVALHELAHGLGFSGTATYDDGDNSNGMECDGTSGVGCYGLVSASPYFPVIYDHFIDIDNGISLIGLTNHSTDIGTNITGGSITSGSGGLYFDDANSNLYRASYAIYSPPNFSEGSSFSHFDLDDHPTELMKHALTMGQAIHDPGLATFIMEEIGWSSSVLPVQWLDFTGENVNGEVYLEWSTVREVSSDYYEIERSDDGIDFEIIGKIPGAGNSLEQNDYDFIDPLPSIGVNYYRLKQIDFDRSFSYSDVIKVSVKEQNQSISISPNPVIHHLNIDLIKSKKLPSRISIYRTTGQMITSVLIPENNPTRYVMDVSALPSGQYLIRVVQGTTVFNGKLIKMN